MARKVRVAIIGSGSMASAHASSYAAIPGVELVAAVDTDPAQLAAFRKKHRIPEGFASLDEALAWGGFDAVSNTTPDSVHTATTMPLLAAGKHVLCEKPLATNEADARKMTRAARKAGVVNMVNLSYRNADAVQEAARLVAKGRIGKVRHVMASYLQSWLSQPAWGDWRKEPRFLWRLSTKHGSKGVLGDVGVHAVDFASFAAGQEIRRVSCQLATFDKARGGRIGEYRLDANDSATIQAVLGNGALATISLTRFATGHLNDLSVEVYGDKGGLRVTTDSRKSRLDGCLGGDIGKARWKRLPCPKLPTTYQRFIAAIRGGAAAAPDFERGAAMQAVLDRAEESSKRSGRFLKV